MSSDEARDMAAGNPLRFLHVSKPELTCRRLRTCMPRQSMPRARKTSRSSSHKARCNRTSSPASTCTDKSWAGIRSPAWSPPPVARNTSGVIKKHELTRADKEDDRVRHIETLNAQTGPVFLDLPRPPRNSMSLSPAKPPSPPDRGFHRPGRRSPFFVDNRQCGRDSIRDRPVFADSLSLYCRRASPLRGRRAHLPIPPGRRPEWTISGGDLSPQPDADPAL